MGAFVADYLKKWGRFLTCVEYHYNTIHHSSIKMTPFRAVYGRPPPTIPTYVRGQSKIEAVEGDLLTNDEILQHLKKNLMCAQ